MTTYEGKFVLVHGGKKKESQTSPPAKRLQGKERGEEMLSLSGTEGKVTLFVNEERGGGGKKKK